MGPEHSILVQLVLLCQIPFFSSLFSATQWVAWKNREEGREKLAYEKKIAEAREFVIHWPGIKEFTLVEDSSTLEFVVQGESKATDLYGCPTGEVEEVENLMKKKNRRCGV